MAQQVKDPVLSLMWLWFLLWRGFHPWPCEVHMPWMVPEKKNRLNLLGGRVPLEK